MRRCYRVTLGLLFRIIYRATPARDIAELVTTDKEAAAEVLVFLETVKQTRDPIDVLTQRGNTEVSGLRFNLTPWIMGTGRAMNQLWRARVLDCPATSYRIVYGYHQNTRQIAVLAVAHKKDFDYESDSPLGRRILADWRAFA